MDPELLFPIIWQTQKTMETLIKTKIYNALLSDYIFKIQKEIHLESPENTTLIFTGFNLDEINEISAFFNEKHPQDKLYTVSTKKDKPNEHISVFDFDTLLNNQKRTNILLPLNEKIKLQNFEYFEEVKSTTIQERIKLDLIKEIPVEFKKVVNEDIIQCLDYVTKDVLSLKLTIEYLLTIKKIGYTPENIGNSLYILNLFPDSDIITNKEQTRNRISSNLNSVSVLCQFDLPLYNRLRMLAFGATSKQRDLVDLFRTESQIDSAEKLTKIVFDKYDSLNFSNWEIDYEKLTHIALPSEHYTPKYDLMIGNSKHSPQFGIIGESLNGKKIALDLGGTNTISLFGVQGGGKSYTIGTITEMVLKQFSYVSELPSPLAGVIFHYSESMDYEPEFTSMMYANSEKREIDKLKQRYGADPESLDDVILLCPKDMLKEKQLEYPSIQIEPIAFNPKELNVQDWMFMLGALGNQDNYVKQLKVIAKKYRKNISLDAIENDIKESILFTEFEKGLAIQKLDFAREYVSEKYNLHKLLKPGRLIIVDLRDEFIDKDEALGLFVVILNIFSAVKEFDGIRFNKFIVFDEAHKYMDNKALTSTIVTAIREMRHKGVNIMIASQDPPSLPKEIIELSSVVLLHKFNSPQWLTHIKNALTQLEILAPQDMSVLVPGEAYLWATKATEKAITFKPLKISARPRVTQHGGATLQASGGK